MKAIQIDTTGVKVNDLELEEGVFGVKGNATLVAQYVRVYLEKHTRGTKKTKGKGEVRGGGRKPWRQKGTGRARHGSTRSPLWVGGGHTHSILPNLDRRVVMPQKMRLLALATALSGLKKQDAVVFISEINLPKPKTKVLTEMLSAAGVKDEKVLLVTNSQAKVVYQSARNIPNVDVTEGRLLNAYDLLDHTRVVFLGDAYKDVEKLILSSK